MRRFPAGSDVIDLEAMTDLEGVSSNLTPQSPHSADVALDELLAENEVGTDSKGCNDSEVGADSKGSKDSEAGADSKGSKHIFKDSEVCTDNKRSEVGSDSKGSSHSEVGVDSKCSKGSKDSEVDPKDIVVGVGGYIYDINTKRYKTDTSHYTFDDIMRQRRGPWAPRDQTHSQMLIHQKIEKGQSVTDAELEALID